MIIIRLQHISRKEQQNYKHSSDLSWNSPLQPAPQVILSKVKMLWRLTLAVAVVCVGGVCNCVKGDVMSRLLLSRDYGVKLCGREFIRAVIFTCGGSRWRRSADGDPGELTLLPSRFICPYCIIHTEEYPQGCRFKSSHCPDW